MDEIEQLRQEKELLQLRNEVRALKKTGRIQWIVFSIMAVIGLLINWRIVWWNDQFSIGELTSGVLLCMPLLIKLVKSRM